MFNWLFKKVVTFREKVAVDLGQKDDEKPFLDHLDDLRSMIMRMAISLLVVTVFTFVFYKELLQIIQYPLVLAGISENIVLQNFKVTGGFMTAMNISLVAAIILSFPLLLYFLLQFVLPGMRTNETKVLFPALGVGGGLFVIGVLFAYYVVAPRALEFFYEFSVTVGTAGAEQKVTGPQQAFTSPLGILWENKAEGVKNLVEASTDGQTWTTLTPTQAEGAAPSPNEFRYIRIISTPEALATPPAEAVAGTVTAMSSRPFIWEMTEYVKFLCQFILIFGACFELPVVVMALVKLDVLNYKVMKTSRSWAAIIICIVAAIITPTADAMTLGLLAVPMYILYEICIWLAWWLEKRDRELYPEYYKEQDENSKEVEVADDWDNENYNPWNNSDGNDDDDDTSKSEGTASSSKPAAPAAALPSTVEEPDKPAATDTLGDTNPGTPAAPADHSHGDEVPPKTAKDDEGPDAEKRDTD